MNWAKNWKIPMWFKKENKDFRDFRVFDFAHIPKIENSEISEILFTSNFDTDCSSRFKNGWAMIKDINEHFWDFRVFDSVLYAKSKTQKSRKVWSYLII